MTLDEAIDEMYGMFFTNFPTPAAVIVGYAPELRWQNNQPSKLPDTSKYWCRLSTQSVVSGQKTLASPKRRFQHDGLLFVQLFAPTSDTQGQTKLNQLAELAKNVYEGKATAGNIWFRNVRIVPLSADGKAYRANVVSEYQYDEIK